MFFSGAVTSSPIKRRTRSSYCQSPDSSLLSPDSSYVCYTPYSSPCSCRRSPRLLTNGYYSVTEASFSLDDDGNVSLDASCAASVSYKENLVRVFRRRRRPRSSFARLLSDVTDSWRVLRGVFGTRQDQDQDQDQVQVLDQVQDQVQDQDQDLDWTKTRKDREESMWTMLSATELEDSRGFTYDPSEAPPPPDKQAPPPPDKQAPPPQTLVQEEICSESCQSKSGLSEVPPPSAFYTNHCCRSAPQTTGLTMKTLLLFIFTVFILTTLYSRCLLWSFSVSSTIFLLISTFMFVTKSGPMGEWRRAKTEDITSRNE